MELSKSKINKIPKYTTMFYFTLTAYLLALLTKGLCSLGEGLALITTLAECELAILNL